MGEVHFYHLTRRPVEQALPMLLERALAQGWRVAVRGTDPTRLEWLDEKLWLEPKDGFLPHGLAGGARDADQPVLLTSGAEAPNNPHCVMAIDGALLDPTEVGTLMRSCVLFDGLDGEALSRARAQWKTLTDAGCAARYWSEESGKWQEKATRNL